MRINFRFLAMLFEQFDVIFDFGEIVLKHGSDPLDGFEFMCNGGTGT